MRRVTGAARLRGWVMAWVVSVVAIAGFGLGGPGAGAQQAGFWVQIEAQPTLGQAQTRARVYEGRLADVNGFFLGTGWYGIALGPYSEADALRLLEGLQSAGAIPPDSFIATGSQFRQQFWPVGVATPTAPRPLPATLPDLLPQAGAAAGDVAVTVLPPPGAPLGLATAPEAAPGTAPETAPAAETAAAPATAPGVAPDVAAAAPQAVQDEPAPLPPALDETEAEARASEAALSQADRAALQVALAWAGHYAGGIDGLFGPGTRAAMAEWQAAAGRPATGMLTGGQRAELLAAYDAVLEGIDLQPLREERAGIEIAIPGGVVAFGAYDPPFVRFDPVSPDFEARVLLISQPGDRARLTALYETMQSLAAIPPEGPRSRGETGFEIEGIGPDLHSYARAELRDGIIKGFALVWPAGDEARRDRVLSEMRASFRTIPGLLDAGLAPGETDQPLDLVAGLEIRKPRLSRSGFFVDPRGTVLTTAEAVEGCGRITLDADHAATVAHLDAARGLAVLRPETPLAPLGVAALQTRTPPLPSQVAVGGYPYGGVLTMPSLTFGSLADLRGLDGAEGVARLALRAEAGDAGGPVLDAGGAVLGMLLPRSDAAAAGTGTGTGRVLPEDVGFAADAGAIRGALAAAGVTPRETDATTALPTPALVRAASDMTVLVGCWD